MPNAICWPQLWSCMSRNWKQGQNEKWLIPLLFSKCENLCLSGWTMLHQNPSTQRLFVTNTVCVGLTGRTIGFNMKGKKRREYHWLKFNTGISHNLEETWRLNGERRKMSADVTPALILDDSDELDQSVMEKRNSRIYISFYFLTGKSILHLIMCLWLSTFKGSTIQITCMDVIISTWS